MSDILTGCRTPPGERKYTLGLCIHDTRTSLWTSQVKAYYKCCRPFRYNMSRYCTTPKSSGSRFWNRPCATLESSFSQPSAKVSSRRVVTELAFVISCSYSGVRAHASGDFLLAPHGRQMDQTVPQCAFRISSSTVPSPPSDCHVVAMSQSSRRWQCCHHDIMLCRTKCVGGLRLQVLATSSSRRFVNEDFVHIRWSCLNLMVDTVQEV